MEIEKKKTNIVVNWHKKTIQKRLSSSIFEGRKLTFVVYQPWFITIGVCEALKMLMKHLTARCWCGRRCQECIKSSRVSQGRFVVWLMLDEMFTTVILMTVFTY